MSSSRMTSSCCVSWLALCLNALFSSIALTAGLFTSSAVVTFSGCVVSRKSFSSRSRFSLARLFWNQTCTLSSGRPVFSAISWRNLPSGYFCSKNPASRRNSCSWVKTVLQRRRFSFGRKSKWNEINCFLTVCKWSALWILLVVKFYLIANSSISSDKKVIKITN